MKKLLATIGMFALLQVGVIPLSLTAAQAATSGTLTIVSSGGDAENSGWTYSSNTIELTSSSSINAADIESKLDLGALVLFADEIVIEASLSSNTSNNLTFKSRGSIRMSGDNVTINSGGGDILFQANSEDDDDGVVDGVGEIRLGNLTTDGGSISSGGGDISLVGGANPSTGFAVATTDVPSGNATPPAAGVALYGFDLDAGGGDIVIRGNSGTGKISNSTRAVMEYRTDDGNSSSITTSGSGAVTIEGDASSHEHPNAWGINSAALQITTGSGNIYIIGTGNPNLTQADSGANARGMVVTMTIVSTSGNVSFEDKTDGSSSKYKGTLMTADITTGGTVTVKADEYVSSNLDVTADSFTLESYSTNSFQATTSMGAIDLTGTPTAQLGHPSNTADLVVSGVTSTDGSITLNSSGTITQGAEIVAAELNFGSTASVTLEHTDNDVDVIAAGATVGGFKFFNKDDLEIGTVGTSSGIASSGVIQIETFSGDLSVTQLLDSSATSVDSVILAADKDAPAETLGDGNIKITGSGAVSADVTSRALMFSGYESASDGLLSLVGGESFTRTPVARTTSLASVSPAVASTGKFAFFRQVNPTSAVYSGPIVSSIGDGLAGPYPAFGGQTVRIEGQRLGSVDRVFVDGIEGTVVSASDDHFIMVVPEGVGIGTHDLVINSSIGNLTFLDGFIVSSAGASEAEANAVCEGVETSWWTKRISETQAKAYIKCPEVGKKYRVLHQTGGSGDYESVFVKTLAGTGDEAQVFNSIGRYIVQTIELEDINRIRISVDGVDLWKVRYNGY